MGFAFKGAELASSTPSLSAHIECRTESASGGSERCRGKANECAEAQTDRSAIAPHPEWKRKGGRSPSASSTIGSARKRRHPRAGGDADFAIQTSTRCGRPQRATRGCMINRLPARFPGRRRDPRREWSRIPRAGWQRVRIHCSPQGRWVGRAHTHERSAFADRSCRVG